MADGFTYQMTRRQTGRLVTKAWRDAMRERGTPAWSPLAVWTLLRLWFVVVWHGGLVLRYTFVRPDKSGE